MIEVKNIHKKFGDNLVLNDVSFNFQRGKTNLIIGESGSGKTSVALAILKLIKSEGSLVFKNRDLRKLNKIENLQFRKHAQIIFQDPYGSLSPKMTIEEIVGEGLDIHEKHSKQLTK